MSRLLISLGANLGNSYETMQAAAGMLRDEFGKTNIRLSRLYLTPPVGGPSGQSDFLNAVASIRTEQSCWEVWEVIKRIEKDLGRQRLHRWEARRLDMDILLYEDLRIWTPHLKIPHPRMCMRSFVLVPAMDVAPEAIDPITGWTIDRLYCNLLRAKESTIAVISNSGHSSRELEQRLAKAASPTASPALRFATCTVPDQILRMEIDEGSESLRIFCVRTPEPETILWEDFAYPWALALGLVTSDYPTHVLGPRYLLPDNDADWTVHEIEASRHAMTCPIHPFDRPFGDF